MPKFDKDKTIPLNQDQHVPDRGGWFWPIMVTVITLAALIGVILLFTQAFLPG